nr:PREDICTED: uncharacterized protein LOC106702875 isoform X3 [Latimeria chalumnae]|eukprot:XP_014341899.1 PREDICTED: uncharacterized protein LOC106702875 isoform X3 [Latimeria chalumnae]
MVTRRSREPIKIHIFSWQYGTDAMGKEDDEDCQDKGMKPTTINYSKVPKNQRQTKKCEKGYKSLRPLKGSTILPKREQTVSEVGSSLPGLDSYNPYMSSNMMTPQNSVREIFRKPMRLVTGLGGYYRSQPLEKGTAHAIGQKLLLKEPSFRDPASSAYNILTAMGEGPAFTMRQLLWKTKFNKDPLTRKCSTPRPDYFTVSKEQKFQPITALLRPHPTMSPLSDRNHTVCDFFKNSSPSYSRRQKPRLTYSKSPTPHTCSIRFYSPVTTTVFRFQSWPPTCTA